MLNYEETIHKRQEYLTALLKIRKERDYLSFYVWAKQFLLLLGLQCVIILGT